MIMIQDSEHVHNKLQQISMNLSMQLQIQRRNFEENLKKFTNPTVIIMNIASGA